MIFFVLFGFFSPNSFGKLIKLKKTGLDTKVFPILHSLHPWLVGTPVLAVLVMQLGFLMLFASLAGPALSFGSPLFQWPSV